MSQNKTSTPWFPIDPFRDTHAWVSDVKNEILNLDCLYEILAVTKSTFENWESKTMPNEVHRKWSTHFRKRIVMYNKVKKARGVAGILALYHKKVKAKGAPSAETGASAGARTGPPVGRGAPPGARTGPIVPSTHTPAAGGETPKRAAPLLPGSGAPPPPPPAASVSAPAAAGSELARLQQAMFTVLFNRVVELEASNKQLEATVQGWMQVSHDLFKLNEGLKEILGAHSHA